MAAALGAPAMARCACMRLESRGAGVVLVSKCNRNWNGLGGWDELRRRAGGLVVMARRNAGGAGASRAQRPSNSRGQSMQREAPKGSRQPGKKASALKTTEEEGDEQGVDFRSAEDPLEALFFQLEKDLEAGGISDDEDFTEEDFLELENELAALMELDGEDEELLNEEPLTTDLVEDIELGSEVDDIDGDSTPLLGRRGSSSRKQINSGEKKTGGPKTRANVEEIHDDLVLEEYEDEEEEERIVTLEPWQLRKLAAAANLGRRKVNIKALSAEVGLDRFDVLTWLKDPPPEMLMYSATMEPEEEAEELPVEHANSNSSPAKSSPAEKQVELNPEGGRNWHSQKRLRKEHVATFERVFSSTDRPSNALIQNLVELTHVPRKRIVDWFEQRRDGVKASPKFEALR